LPPFARDPGQDLDTRVRRATVSDVVNPAAGAFRASTLGSAIFARQEKQNFP
jgi:hypothetical protein